MTTKRATRGKPNLSLDVSKQADFNKKVKKIREEAKDRPAVPGVVYVSHLPWGFEEEPLKEYFSQFGQVRQLRVSRSKKTGNSRGYAYVQFAHDEVAKIVAESMNNYLMFGKLIKCKHLLKPHPETFRNANRKFITPCSQKCAIMKHNQTKTDNVLKKKKKKVIRKYQKQKAKLASLGIDYTLGIMENVKESGVEIKEEVDVEIKEEADTEIKEEILPLINEKSRAIKKRHPFPGTQKTPKRHTYPSTVNTPKGKLNVLIEDSSDDEIVFKTPPSSIRSSKINA